MEYADLYLIERPSGIHSGRYVYGIAPDVVLRLAGSDNTSYHRSDVDACVKLETSYLTELTEKTQFARAFEIYSSLAFALGLSSIRITHRCECGSC